MYANIQVQIFLYPVAYNEEGNMAFHYQEHSKIEILSILAISEDVTTEFYDNLKLFEVLQAISHRKQALLSRYDRHEKGTLSLFSTTIRNNLPMENLRDVV